MMTLILLLALQDDAPVFTKFEFERERVGHKVVATAVLVNPSRNELADVRLTVIYFDGERELKRSKPASVAKVAPEGSVTVKIETEQVEKFSRYQVFLEVGSKQRLYIGIDPMKTPVIRKSEPAKLEAVSASAVPPDAFPGEAVMTLVVRNTGELEAQEPTATVTFVDGSGKAVHQVRARLESEVRGLSEETFAVRIPAVPAYEKVRLGLASLAAEGPAWPDGPKDAATVDLRRARVVRLTDHSIRVTGLVRNGTAGPVRKVTATFKFGSKSHPAAFDGTLKAGETREFEVFVPEAGSFDGGSYSLGYEDGAGEAAAPAPARPVSRRTDSRRVEGGPLLKAPAEKAPEAPLVENTHAKVSVGMKPVGWIEGFLLKNGKYSGDVPLLRMVFVDADGKPCQPTGTVTVTLYEGANPVKKVQRIIAKESWKLDAAKVTNQNVRHDLLAYDAKTNELWVAFHRSEGTAGDVKVDVQAVIRDAGTWEWKGLTPKSSEIAPRGPDKR